MKCTPSVLYVHSVKTLDTENFKVGQRRISLFRKNDAQFDYLLLKIQMISFKYFNNYELATNNKHGFVPKSAP